MPEQTLGWCVLELMGHIRLGGFVTEEERFGSKIGRIDVHNGDGQVVTQYFGGSSVYRITPTTEQIAKAIGAQSEAPISRWELRALEPAKPEPQRCEQCGVKVPSGVRLCADCEIEATQDDDEE